MPAAAIVAAMLLTALSYLVLTGYDFLALRYVRHSELSFSEITFLLGFSQAAAFYRAFRRWTGLTPREFRQSPLAPLPDY